MRQLTLIHILTLYQYYVCFDCRVIKKTWADFVVPADQLRGGLCDDVKPALYYPGFPTFKHLDHRSYLQKMGVTVFQQASRLATKLSNNNLHRADYVAPQTPPDSESEHSDYLTVFILFIQIFVSGF